MTVLDGNETAEKYRQELTETVSELKDEGTMPTIAPILVGDDPGARIYYKQKKKLAQNLGVRFAGVKLESSVGQAEIEETIEELNNDEDVHGLFIELPLPEGLRLEDLAPKIAPEKDIDCINPASSGKLIAGGAARRSYEELKNSPDVLLPATPYGVMELLLSYEINLEKKETVIVGGGANGLPLAMLILRQGYSTVSICEYREENLVEKTKRADVLVSAVGKMDFITSEMISEGTVIIDVGINETDSGITGDVDYGNVKAKASYITPVPGGVGPMTTTMIMKNTVKAAKNLK